MLEIKLVRKKSLQGNSLLSWNVIPSRFWGCCTIDFINIMLFQAPGTFEIWGCIFSHWKGLILHREFPNRYPMKEFHFTTCWRGTVLTQVDIPVMGSRTLRKGYQNWREREELYYCHSILYDNVSNQAGTSEQGVNLITQSWSYQDGFNTFQRRSTVTTFPRALTQLEFNRLWVSIPLSWIYKIHVCWKSPNSVNVNRIYFTFHYLLFLIIVHVPLWNMAVLIAFGLRL